MRKIIIMVIAIVMLFSVFAQADALTLAAGLDANEQFERYSSYLMDESTGNWSAHGLYSQQMLSTAGQSDIGSLMSDGVCLIHPGIRGNRKLSLMEPVLYVYLLRGNALKAEALSISTGGIRYDFVCDATVTNLNDRQDRPCEQFILPLDEEGMTLLRSLATNCGEVRIIGEKQVFRTSIVKPAEAKNARQRFEAMALPAISEFLTVWPVSYSLWDLNAAYWNSDRPIMAAVSLNQSDYPSDWPALEKSTLLLDTKNSAAVKAYQQLLKDKAFFTSSPDSNYGKVTMNSTRQAQQYYGLAKTGLADRTLIECLHGIQPESVIVNPSVDSIPFSDDVEGAILNTEYVLGEQLSIRLDKAWNAHSVSPTIGTDSMELKEPSDRSNTLLVVDGEIANLAETSMEVPSMIHATMRVSNVPYICTVQCERDKGAAFGTTLLPMGKSRLLIVCEIPEGLELASVEMEIDVVAGSEQFSLFYPIQ
ncbi:MAG: peptidoglycan-binding protein [Clostridia bacterium]|nr:peptidoglycan-binding protein [Clostridia bacterium]